MNETVSNLETDQPTNDVQRHIIIHIHVLTLIVDLSIFVQVGLIEEIL